VKGDIVVAGSRVDVKPGNAMLLKNIPVGTIVHNVEMKPARAARSRARLALMCRLWAAIPAWCKSR